MISDCDYTRKHLCAYLGRDIEIGEGEWISLHLQRCSSCRAAYRQLFHKQEHLRREIGNWVSDNRLPQDWGLEFRADLVAYINNAGWHRRLIRHLWARNWLAVRRAAMITAVLLLFVFISPFFFWLASRLPYYGPWAERLVAPVMHTRLGR